MVWIDQPAIVAGVVKMLTVNLGAHEGDRILVLSDTPTAEQWARLPSGDVEVMLRRAYLGKLVADIARERLARCPVIFATYPSTGRNAVEPPGDVARAMREAQVVFAITSFSLSHTDAREVACRQGARVASMPRFLPEMLYPDGPMAADYAAIDAATRAMAGLITATRRVHIVTPAGTDVQFSVEGRDGCVDAGIYTSPGSWGNLPAGEAYCAPLEGTARGRLVVEPGWHAKLTEPMTFHFEDGEVSALEGGGPVGQEIGEIINLAGRSVATRPRRMLGELGIGTNPNARRTDITVEAEKIKGTVHLAIGDNSHMGGVNAADYHQDFVLPRPDMWFDDLRVVHEGRWVAPAVAEFNE
jgi:leucyl aminopeptidase (aminopeptidase T)